MKLIINGTKSEIPAISKLSFTTFSKVFIDAEVFDLKGYIALFSNLPVDELMQSEIKTMSMPALHAVLFDVDIEKTVKSKTDTFEHDGNIHVLKEMTLSTFGQNYLFDLYFEQFKAKKINEYQLCLYGLSCYLTADLDSEEVQKHYSELADRNWTEVLPTAFFLTKKLLKKKKGSWLLSIVYTVGLKRMKLLSSSRTDKYKNSVKKLLPKFWLKY